MPSRPDDVDMRPVDTSHLHISEEDAWAEFFKLNISGQDNAVYIRSWDRT